MQIDTCVPRRIGDGAETQFGRTKLFVKRPETYFALEKLRERKLGEYASKIARASRRAKDVKDFVLLQRDVSRRFSRLGKRRRASSANRPYAGTTDGVLWRFESSDLDTFVRKRGCERLSLSLSLSTRA